MTENNKSLFGKVARVMGAVRRLPKDGTNTFDKYQYISADNAFENIGRAMAEVNLVALPSVLELTTTEGTTKQGGVQLRTLIHGSITLADGDSGETWTSDWWGEGVDRGDKSVNKAMTAMMKYYLLRLFMVGSGEDADADSPEVSLPKPVVKSPVLQAQHRTARPPAPVSIENRSQLDTALDEIDVADSEPMAFDEEPPTKVRDWLATGDPVATAKAWAVECKAQANDFAARNSLKKIVDAQGGRLNKDNMHAILTAYYFRQVEHMSDARGVAVA